MLACPSRMARAGKRARLALRVRRRVCIRMRKGGGRGMLCWQSGRAICKISFAMVATDCKALPFFGQTVGPNGRDAHEAYHL